MNIRFPQVALAGALALTAGCAVGPRHVAPAAPPSAQGPFLGASEAGIAAAPVPDDWWRLFDDPALDAHVGRALAANADIRVALANLEAARAATRGAQAAQLPNAMLESGAGPSPAQRQPSTSAVPKSSYDLAATIAYEVDLFGRLRATTQAARADLEASEAARDTVRVAVAADTAAAYAAACGAAAGKRVAEAQLTAQQRSYDLIARQLDAGEVSPLELAQSRTLLDRARAALPAFDADRARALFQLATLQGLPPREALRLALPCMAAPIARHALPVGDGNALLVRRPDIREAERKLAAATARIGVATADLYPRFQLGGSAGLLGGDFTGFLTPLISWAFPNQSAARARIAAARGIQAAALAGWDVAVLRALREVETALADYQAEKLRNAELRGALAASEKVVARAGARFRLGADSYLQVVDAERTRNDTGALLVASDLRIALTQVALFRALGGGWGSQPGAASTRGEALPVGSR
ncbi:efflux transporter outer membrane subunit [Sphingomonas sp. NPDC092331]|jgi:NodT family efflux transporter outer membrane factor (OMF) lipoprotein|uniref:efflux transporter outer membrane subunit n=1 Tax=unclassified Sphingomonas TaxID=196159 RepID=UPI0029F41F95|nr:efflux transporter outer membrane subunit [Pseudomonadota bacterium]